MSKKNNKNLSHSAFKELARQHQIAFKTAPKEKGGLGIVRFPTRVMHRRNKDGELKEYEIPVKSSLMWEDSKDASGNYIIFYEGFRKQISEAVKSRTRIEKSKEGNRFSCSQMVTNLLRSEHIPYNVFFPLHKDDETVALFNDILGEARIESISDIRIEFAPVRIDAASSKEVPLLGDGTAFDVYVEYIPLNSQPGQKGGIGIEVKYTEKEYRLNPESKEFHETHDSKGIHLADNYKIPSHEIGWFKPEYLADVQYEEKDKDVPNEEKDKIEKHFVADKFRQIWRNHLLGAAMILNGDLCEFTSLTVFPEGNGHFREDDKNHLWLEYKKKLTDEGKATLKYLTFENLFSKLRKHLHFQGATEWIDYLERRYIPSSVFK